MKHIRFLSVFVLAAVCLLSGAAAGTSGDVEIRSAVIAYDGSSFSGGSGSGDVLDPMNFAAFYYDLDADVGTESIRLIKNGTGGKIDIIYETRPAFREYAYREGNRSSDQYAVIGFFGAPHVALKTVRSGIQANRIAPLLTDSDETVILRTGQSLDLGAGYALYVKQLDAGGRKAWLELKKDGRTEDDGIISLTSGNPSWIMRETVLGEKGTEVFRVHIEEIFQGTESSLVEIKGIWLVDYANAVEVKDGANVGKFEADSIGKDALSYKVSGYMPGNDKDDLLGGGIRIKTVEKNSGIYDICFYVRYSDNGTYDIRSTVYPANGRTIITPAHFSCLYDDPDADIRTETIDIAVGDKIGKGGFKYYSAPTPKPYAFDGWRFDGRDGSDRYYMVGLFGEPYAALSGKNGSDESSVRPDKIAELLIDSDEKYTLTTGQVLDLGKNYTLRVNQIDVGGNKVLTEVLKDGKTVDTAVIGTAGKNADERTWVLERTVLGEDGIQVLRVCAAQIFQGSESSLVEISGLWAVDFENARELKEGETFGQLKFDGIGTVPSGLPITGRALIFKNDAAISLSDGRDIAIGGGIDLRMSEDGKRFFLFGQKIVGSGIASKSGSISDGSSESRTAKLILPSVSDYESSSDVSDSSEAMSPESPVFAGKYTAFTNGTEESAASAPGPGFLSLLSVLAAGAVIGRRWK